MVLRLRCGLEWALGVGGRGYKMGRGRLKQEGRREGVNGGRGDEGRAEWIETPQKHVPCSIICMDNDQTSYKAEKRGEQKGKYECC